MNKIHQKKQHSGIEQKKTPSLIILDPTISFENYEQQPKLVSEEKQK